MRGPDRLPRWARLLAGAAVICHASPETVADPWLRMASLEKPASHIRWSSSGIRRERELRGGIAEDIRQSIKAMNGPDGSIAYIQRAAANQFQAWVEASDLGWPAGLWLLGRCHDEGICVPEDDTAAFELYRRAAVQGFPLAQNSLGECYRRGLGVLPDPAEAVRWYRMAADQNNATAQANLGFCLQLGIGAKKDEEAAVLLYRMAARQGNATAQYNLGCCYELGQGLRKSRRKAIKWYRKAAAQGDPDAQKALQRIDRRPGASPSQEPREP